MRTGMTIATVVLLGLALKGNAAEASRAASQPAGGTGDVMTGKFEGQILAAGAKRVVILDSRGKLLWEHPSAVTGDAWMLPNGNVLYADGATVTEVTRDHKVAFCYKPAEQKGGGAYSCQRLENGNTVVGENSTARVLELDPNGKVVFELPVTLKGKGDHHNLRMVRKLDNGNYLVCHSGLHMLKEYTPEGKVVLEIKNDNIVFAAIRTPKNTTLVASLSHIREYDSAGKAVWEFANTDISGVLITNMTGMHLLPGGNIAVGCYGAYKGGEGTGLFEITPEKKLVWRYSNPGKDSSMMAVQVLDGQGKALPGKCLR